MQNTTADKEIVAELDTQQNQTEAKEAEKIAEEDSTAEKKKHSGFGVAKKADAPKKEEEAAPKKEDEAPKKEKEEETKEEAEPAKKHGGFGMPKTVVPKEEDKKEEDKSKKTDFIPPELKGQMAQSR